MFSLFLLQGKYYLNGVFVPAVDLGRLSTCLADMFIFFWRRRLVVFSPGKVFGLFSKSEEHH